MDHAMLMHIVWTGLLDWVVACEFFGWPIGKWMLLFRVTDRMADHPVPSAVGTLPGSL